MAVGLRCEFVRTRSVPTLADLKGYTKEYTWVIALISKPSPCPCTPGDTFRQHEGSTRSSSHNTLGPRAKTHIQWSVAHCPRNRDRLPVCTRLQVISQGSLNQRSCAPYREARPRCTHRGFATRCLTFCVYRLFFWKRLCTTNGRFWWVLGLKL